MPRCFGGELVLRRRCWRSGASISGAVLRSLELSHSYESYAKEALISAICWIPVMWFKRYWGKGMHNLVCRFANYVPLTPIAWPNRLFPGPDIGYGVAFMAR